MPLPCSPVSNSTASESQSFPTSDDSDASLTTPRPGPADPAQRTVSNLSTPFSVFSPTTATTRSRDKQSTRSTAAVQTTSSEGPPLDDRSDTHISLSSSKDSENRASIGSNDRKRSVTFQPHTAPPKPSRESSYASHSHMTTSESPSRSPFGGLRSRVGQDLDGGAADSSADENTAIMQKSSLTQSNYGAVSANGNTDSLEQDRLIGYEEQVEGSQRRKPSSLQLKRNNRHGSLPARGQEQTQESTEAGHVGWFRSLIDKYGSVELENKGSVARDHLALERTFLAWLRTSLSFASIGIAVTQLFRLNTTITSHDPDSPSSIVASTRLRHVGKPLGATFLGISILILVLGFHRYFESQHYVIRGKFPASRGTIIIVSAVATALIVASLIVVVAIAPQAFEK